MNIYTPKSGVAWALCRLGIAMFLFPRRILASPSVFQAEAGSLTNVKIDTRHSGYEGTGYADYSNHGGGSIQWTYNAPVSGDVDIQIRYATKNARPLDLYVDGTMRVAFDCNSTGSWSTWATETSVLSLDKGTHTLRLEAPFNGPNVDWLSVTSHEQYQPVPTVAPTATSLSVSASSTVVYQAEAAHGNKISIRTDYSGFDGSGYADFQGFGAFLLWTIEAPTSSASYELKVKYASGNTRNCNLYIDGVFEGTFSFDGTGSWASWENETMIVPLSEGTHELKILAENSPGPNINWLLVSSLGSSGEPVPAPTPRPVPNTPKPSGTGTNPTSYPSRVVVKSNGQLDKGEFVFSPNGNFKVGLTNQGDFVMLRSNGDIVWSAGTALNGYRLYVQSDGNVIVRTSSKQAIWTSKTYGHAGAQLVVDDGGRLAVAEGDLAIWIQGIPRGTYSGRPATNLQFPIRGIFYYSWYPETWTLNGKQVHFVPDLGLYSSSDPSVVQNHIRSFDYAHVDLVISSWWGPDTNLDRGRMTLLMEEISNANSNVKITFYYEEEMKKDLHPQ